MKQNRLLVSLLVSTLLLGSLTAGAVLAQAEPTVSMIFVQDDLKDAITELVLQTGINIYC